MSRSTNPAANTGPTEEATFSDSKSQTSTALPAFPLVKACLNVILYTDGQRTGLSQTTVQTIIMSVRFRLVKGSTTRLVVN
jgi:hypothetical protein